MDILNEGITREAYNNLYMGSELQMLWHCKADPRFCYHTYIPATIYHEPKHTYRIMCFVHGTGRTIEEYRKLFSDFADKNDLILLFPYFPGGLMDENDFNSYKLLSYQGVRYDNILLSMVDELTKRYPVDGEKIYLYGWSGGGQFVHRFLYVHPERLAAVVSGAPGRITYIDGDNDYFWGIRDFEAVFDKPFDIEKICNVPLKLLIGENDVDFIGESKWGTSRMERMLNYKKNLEENGVNPEMTIMPGIGHKGNDHIKAPYVMDFFQRVMDNKFSPSGENR